MSEEGGSVSVLFRHALELAWTDGRLSRRGALLLEKLQEILDLSDEDRSFVEEVFHVDVVPYLIPRGFGSGSALLDQWMNDLIELDEELPRYLVSMGRQALENGIERAGWKKAFAAAERMECSFDFARGVWEPEFEVEIIAWPETLDPLAKALGLIDEEE